MITQRLKRSKLVPNLESDNSAPILELKSIRIEASYNGYRYYNFLPESRLTKEKLAGDTKRVVSVIFLLRIYSFFHFNHFSGCIERFKYNTMDNKSTTDSLKRGK